MNAIRLGTDTGLLEQELKSLSYTDFGIFQFDDLYPEVLRTLLPPAEPLADAYQVEINPVGDSFSVDVRKVRSESPGIYFRSKMNPMVNRVIVCHTRFTPRSAVNTAKHIFKQIAMSAAYDVEHGLFRFQHLTPGFVADAVIRGVYYILHVIFTSPQIFDRRGRLLHSPRLSKTRHKMIGPLETDVAPNGASGGGGEKKEKKNKNIPAAVRKSSRIAASGAGDPIGGPPSDFLDIASGPASSDGQDKMAAQARWQQENVDKIRNTINFYAALGVTVVKVIGPSSSVNVVWELQGQRNKNGEPKRSSRICRDSLDVIVSTTCKYSIFYLAALINDPRISSRINGPSLDLSALPDAQKFDFSNPVPLMSSSLPMPPSQLIGEELMGGLVNEDGLSHPVTMDQHSLAPHGDAQNHVAPSSPSLSLTSPGSSASDTPLGIILLHNRLKDIVVSMLGANECSASDIGPALALLAHEFAATTADSAPPQDDGGSMTDTAD